MTAAPFRAPYTIFVIGGAATSGWNTQDAVPFVQDIDNPYLYTCSTELKVRKENVESNLFKILGQPDWGPYSLHPTVSEQSITDAERFVENGDDTKWSVPSDKQGMYLLTVDLWKGTINGKFLNEEFNAKGKFAETTYINKVSADEALFVVSANGGTVVVDSALPLSNARLVSMSGSMVAASATASNHIELGGNIRPGVYVVSAEATDGQVHTKKIAVSY